MMLDHIGQGAAAARMRAAVEATLRERKTVTPDAGGTATTDQFADAVMGRLGD
jgi:isocitrate/isopropylmalate dehydrogenase